MRTRGVQEWYPIPPHTIIPGTGPVLQCITQLFSILSPRCLQTPMQPSTCYRLKCDLSVKTVSFHCAIYIFLSSHNWRQRHLWLCIKDRQSNGCLADRPLCCKQCRMLCPNTGWCVTDWICCAMVCGVTEQSITAMHTICLSSHESGALR